MAILDSGTEWPPSVWTDANRVSQIIINLVSNALKYTQEGYVLLYSRVNIETKTLSITVEDSGVGMTEAQVDSLFQVFTKIMSNRELNKDGVGLGLTISRNIAQALGGDLTVTSEVGIGSKFTLTLAMRESDVK